MDEIKILSPDELKNLSDGYLDEYINQLNEYMLDGMDPGDLEQFRGAMKEARSVAAERKAAREALEEQQRLEKEAEEERLRKEKEEAGGWERETYIDTSYGLQTLDEDQSRKGTVFLVLSAMLSAFYLAFSIPYWYRILQGLSIVNEQLGEQLPRNVVIVHLSLIGAALILNIIAAFSGKSLFAIFASLLYALAILPAPSYVIYAGLQCLLCLIAGFQKKAARMPVKVLRIVILIPSLVIVTLTALVRFEVITSAQVPMMDKVLDFAQRICGSKNEENSEDETEWEDNIWEDDTNWDDEDWDDEDLEDDTDWEEGDADPEDVAYWEDESDYEDDTYWDDDTDEDGETSVSTPMTLPKKGLLKYGP